MALTIDRGASDVQMSPKFEEALTPKEFVAKFGEKQAVLSETDNTHRLSLGCIDAKGNLTSALAGDSLQEEYENTPMDKEFRLPENTRVVPVYDANGINHWTMFLHTELVLKESSRRAIAQIF